MAWDKAIPSVFVTASSLALAPSTGARTQVLSIGDESTVTICCGPKFRIGNGGGPITGSAGGYEPRFSQAAVSSKVVQDVTQPSSTTASDLGVDPSQLRGAIDEGAAGPGRPFRLLGDAKPVLTVQDAASKAVEWYGGVPPYAETQTHIRACMARPAAASAVGAGAP